VRSLGGREHDHPEFLETFANGFRLCCRGFHGVSVPNELHTEVQPFSVDGADERMTFREFLKPVCQSLPDSMRVLLETFVTHGIEHGDPDRAAHWVSAR